MYLPSVATIAEAVVVGGDVGSHISNNIIMAKKSDISGRTL